jgi:glycosyltransferase involved in cell wall biosynthesis
MGVSMLPVRASVVLLTYNQEAFVHEALQSLLDQDYDDLEIVLSDDASKDDTWRVVTELASLYTGPKRLVLHQNSTNLGIGANYANAFSLTHGEVVFSAAGDDVSLPTRCTETIAAWLATNKVVDLVATDAFDMTVEGHLVGHKKIDNLQNWDLSKWFVGRPHHFGASHMMTRRMLVLNSLHPQLNAEDQCLMFRALLMGGALRLAKPLVKHRQNGVSYKAKPATYAHKKSKLISDAKASLIESEQMLADASCLIRSAEVEAPFLLNIITQSFVVEVLTGSSFSKMWNAFRNATHVPLGKRIRFFAYAAFPFLYMPGMWLKSTLKK